MRKTERDRSDKEIVVRMTEEDAMAIMRLYRMDVQYVETGRWNDQNMEVNTGPSSSLMNEEMH